LSLTGNFISFSTGIRINLTPKFTVMKKIFISLFVAVLAGLGFYYAFHFEDKNLLKQENEIGLDKNIADANKEEELELRSTEEFLKTVDPSLGYVPTEKLITGEERAREIMGSLAPNSPSIISALTWTERGPNNIGGRTRGFIFDANDATGNTALAGGVGGGIWRTTNFKTGSPVTWTQIASVSQNLAITTIAQNPAALNIMYAGTGEGFNNIDAIRGLGVYKSTDFGVTWSLLASTTTGGANANDFSYVQKILVYTNGDVYVACRSAVFCNAGGLMRSTSASGGSVWTRVVGDFPMGCMSCTCATDFKIFDIEKSASGDLWVSSVTEVTGLGKIWRSPAGGTVGNAGTWVDKTPTGTWQRIELACSPTDNNRIYALLQGGSSSVGGIRRTDNGAAVPATDWVNVTSSTLWCDAGTSSSADFSRGQAWYDLMIAIKPDDDNTVFVGGVDIMKTTSAGTPTSSWAQITQWASGCAALPNIHADIHNIVYLPGSSTEFVVATDGGLFYTANGGTTFAEKNNSYNITQYYSCAIHPASGSNYMLAGAQDNGSHKFTTAGMNAVTTASGGDGGFCEIDQKNPLQQITNFTGTNLNLSNDGGAVFTYIGGVASDRFINPGDFDTASSTTPALSTAARYYCGGGTRTFRRLNLNFVAKSGTFNDFTVTSSTTNHSVSAIKVDPNTTNRVWFAMSTASSAVASVAPQLFYAGSANGTPTFTQITLPGTITTGQYISSIDVERGNASHILITLSNYGVASVYESTNLGVSWTSLDNNGVNLPDVPVRWGMFIPPNYQQVVTGVGGILLATELGVWGTNSFNGTSTPWAQNNTGIGNVRSDMLKLRGSDKVVAVATHGRGLFTGALINVLPVNFVWFKGVPLDNSNRLLWKVGNSINNRGFEIERKYEGENSFSNIGFVAATGSGAADIEYRFDDQNLNLSKQVAIYRLKQVDFSGNYKYSDQLPVKRSQLGKFIYFVSATKNSLFVRAGNKQGIANVIVSIYDAQGKIIYSKSNAYTDMSVDISGYSSGIYFVKIKAVNTGDESTTKFVK